MAYSGGGASGYDWDEHHRDVVARGAKALEQTSQSIARSHVIAVETEQLGTEVIGELSEQRESLLRSRNRVENMDEGLSRSQRIIKNIGRNVLYNKIILVLIIILEVGILATLVFVKLFRK